MAAGTTYLYSPSTSHDVVDGLVQPAVGPTSVLWRERQEWSETVAEGLGAMTFQPEGWPGDWRVRAACRHGDPDRLFVRGAAQREAKLVCFGCPVRPECLAEALDHRIEFGVWGGMTERERRALLRRRPDVPSWQDVLLHARGDADGAMRAG